MPGPTPVPRPHVSDYSDPAVCECCGHRIGYARSVTLAGKILHDLRPRYEVGDCKSAY
jgi:hypothetical protein